MGLFKKKKKKKQSQEQEDFPWLNGKEEDLSVEEVTDIEELLED